MSSHPHHQHQQRRPSTMYQPTALTERNFFPSFLDRGKGTTKAKSNRTYIATTTTTATNTMIASTPATKLRGLTATNPIIVRDVESDDDIVCIPGPTKFKIKDGQRVKDEYEEKRPPRQPYPTPESNPRSPPYKPDVSLGVSSLELIYSSQSSSSDQKHHISQKRHRASAPSLSSSRKIISGSGRPSVSQSNVHAPITQRAYGIKNTGLQATRDVPLGSVIVVEAPFLVLPDVEDHDLERVNHTIQLLSDYFKDVFHSFTMRKDQKDEVHMYQNILDTNGIPLGGPDEADDNRDVDNDHMRKLGLFENICRVNHSCTPNAGWRWDAKEGMMYLYAYSNIRASTEITASYLDDEQLVLPFAERSELLVQDYGFECMCTACTTCRNDLKARTQTDKRLKRFRELQEEWESDEEEPLAFAIDYEEALVTIREAMSIMKTEKKYHAIGQVLERKFTVYSAYGRKENAKRAASEVVQHYASIIGSEKAKELAFADWAADPSRHEFWGDLAYRRTKKKSGAEPRAGSKRRASDVSIWGDDHDYVDH